MSERKGRLRPHEPRRNREGRATSQRLHRRSTRPPRLAQALLALRSAPESREFALGDLAQEYAEHRAERGWMMARGWYWWQAMRSVVGAHGGPGPGRHDKDVHRRRGAVLELIGRDVLLALRSFARSPLFTAAAIVTLALGIGATTAVFSLADAVLFRPIPGIEAPEDVAEVWACGESPRPGGCLMSGLSYPNLRDVSSRLAAFTAPTGGATTCGCPGAPGCG